MPVMSKIPVVKRRVKAGRQVEGSEDTAAVCNCVPAVLVSR